MRKLEKGWIFPLLCLLLAAGLTACRDAGGENLSPEPEEGTLIYASLNPISNEMETRIEKFNEAHTDVQIEVQDYSDEGGVQRLLTELTLGRVPDIMELHRFGKDGDKGFSQVANIDRPEGEYWMPYRQMVQKGYLEDLWPYIENDPELGRESVLEAPLKAAEVDGGLYMVFKHVSITTMFGAESVVGDRYGWTLEELMEVYSGMPEDSTILRYNATRQDIFSRLLCTTLNQYVDWETGQCSFDSEGFRTMLQFLSSFPAESAAGLAFGETEEEELAYRRLGGRQMLEAYVLNSLLSVAYDDVTFGLEERAAYVGYPTADGSYGSFFNLHGNKLAMSSTCRNKEAAWDFMRQLIVKQYHTFGTMKSARWQMEIYIPVNRADYKLANSVDMKERKSDIPPYRAFRGGPVFEVYPPTEEQLQRYEAVINHTTQIFWPNDAISGIVWETLGSYFAGDRTMDDTIALIEDRVGLYVNENR